jgi:hypothetical protein
VPQVHQVYKANKDLTVQLDLMVLLDFKDSMVPQVQLA